MNLRIDTEKARKFVALVTEKIRTEADIRLLDEYHRLFKKEVPLFNRSRVAAYLLMLAEQGKILRLQEHGNENRASGRNSARKSKSGDDRRTARPVGSKGGDDEIARYPLADEDSKWLFFSAGRSRRVAPRDILSLVNAKTELPKGDIGAIRIFDNYSFMQVRDSSVETIMEALNGHVFRGRPLIVNHARSRKDESDISSEADSSSGDAPPEADSSSDDGFSDEKAEAAGLSGQGYGETGLRFGDSEADEAGGSDQHEDEHSKEENV